MALGELRFANGMTLEDAVVTDPVIRARVYDTIRTARITDRTIDEDGTRVSITMELDHGPLLRIINAGDASAGAAPPPPGP